jgi:exodeoxyribonuclease V alpha subunit
MASPAERRQQNGSSSGQPGAGEPTEVLAGSIERVTFHNASNGFCVLRIKARGHRDLVTVVGHAAEISAGEWVTVSGVWVNSREHGQQFKAALSCAPHRPPRLRGSRSTWARE